MTLKQIFEKHSLYIQPEIAERIKDSFAEWLTQVRQEYILQLSKPDYPERVIEKLLVRLKV